MTTLYILGSSPEHFYRTSEILGALTEYCIHLSNPILCLWNLGPSFRWPAHKVPCLATLTSRQNDLKSLACAKKGHQQRKQSFSPPVAFVSGLNPVASLDCT